MPAPTRLAAKPLKTAAWAAALSACASLLPKDFDGTLAKVRADGYTVVEAAGYYDRTAKDFRKAMDNAGLRCVSTHHALSVLETELDNGSNTGKRWGLNTLSARRRAGCTATRRTKGEPTLDDWHWIADEFNRIGEKVKAAGMTFGVHNHTPEFAVIDGVLVYDELLRLTDPKLVVFEMDAAGCSPQGTIRWTT